MYYKRFLVLLLWVVRLATLGGAVFCLYLVFNQYFFPSGKLEVAYGFKEDSEYISHLSPWQRLLPPEEINGVWSQAIKDDLVYFDVKNPRWFQSVTVQLTFQNTNQNIFEIGGRVNSQNGYLVKPLQNLMIDGLDWPRLADGETLLLQKDDIFSSIADFERNVADDKVIGKYFYDYQVDRLLPDYQKALTRTVIDHYIRGDHIIFTYIKNEDLDFTFSKIDLNKYAGPDPVIIDVFSNKTNQRIYRGVAADDGIEDISAASPQPKDVSVIVPNLNEGVYRIEIKGNNDFIISGISTAQKHVVFSRNIFPADNEEYIPGFQPGSKPTILYTDATSLRFKTSHPTGRQTVSIDNQTLSIYSENKYFGTQSSNFSRLYLPKNDVLIESDGFFAFSLDQYFYPFPLNVISLNNETDVNSLDYIISHYSPPAENDGWLVQAQTFDVDNLYRDSDGKIKFRLSAPGLSDDSSVIKIREIKIIFEKPPLTFSNLLERLKNFIIKLIKKE